MFSELDDQIQETSGTSVTWKEQLLRAMSVLVLTTLLFGSLYLGILLFA
jgi:hypothetical protein